MTLTRSQAAHLGGKARARGTDMRALSLKAWAGPNKPGRKPRPDIDEYLTTPEGKREMRQIRRLTRGTAGNRVTTAGGGRSE